MTQWKGQSQGILYGEGIARGILYNDPTCEETERQKHMTKDIPFLQLRWQTVNLLVSETFTRDLESEGNVLAFPLYLSAKNSNEFDEGVKLGVSPTRIEIVDK